MTEETVQPRRKRGRPVGSTTKLKDDVIEEICKGVRLGMTYKSAAIRAGVPYNTYSLWVAKGKKAQRGIYRKFAIALDLAVEEAKAFNLAIINKHIRGHEDLAQTKTTVKRDKDGNIIETTTVTETPLPSLKAAQWMLERRHPDEFGPKQTVKTTDDDLEIDIFGGLDLGSNEIDDVQPDDVEEESVGQ